MDDRSPAADPRPTVGGMPDLHVQPAVLADAGRSLAVQRSVVTDSATALGPAFGGVAAALPGSRAAEVAGITGSSLTVALRAAATDLAQLATALTVAAGAYAAVERSITAGIERAGRRPA